MAILVIQFDLAERMKIAQKEDVGLMKLGTKLHNENKVEFNISDDGVLRF